MELAGLGADVHHAVDYRGGGLDGVARLVGPQHFERARQLRVRRAEERGRAAELRPAIGRSGWRSLSGQRSHRHEKRGECDGSSCAHLLPAAPELEIANNSLRLTMKSAPLAGTGVE